MESRADVAEKKEGQVKEKKGKEETEKCYEKKNAICGATTSCEGLLWSRFPFPAIGAASVILEIGRLRVKGCV